MTRMRDEDNNWTHEAIKYTEEIGELVRKMLDMGRKGALITKIFSILL